MLQKSICAKLSPTVISQDGLHGWVFNKPRPGDLSPSLSRTDIVVASVAKIVAITLNSIPSITCNEVQGAMYASPQVHLPKKAVAAAKVGENSSQMFQWMVLAQIEGGEIFLGLSLFDLFFL